MRSGCPARLPSPKKSPLPKIATIASFPRLERTVSNVKDRVGGTALREDRGFLSIVLGGSAPGLRKVRREIEWRTFFLCHESAPYLSGDFDMDLLVITALWISCGAPLSTRI